MGFRKEQITDFGMSYNYWNIDSFTVTYSKGIKFVDVIFSAYINEETRLKGDEPYMKLSQQISFDIFLVGFKNMVLSNADFTDENIKKALYSLKEYYIDLKDAEDC